MTDSRTPGCAAHRAIAQASAGFVAAFLAQDVQRIARHYTPQGRLLLSHVDLITGRPAIRAFWQGVLDMGISCAERTVVDWQNVDTLGNEIGTYTLCHQDGTIADQGTYVALWQWTGNGWQIRYEVWRSSWLAAVGVPE